MYIVEGYQKDQVIIKDPIRNQLYYLGFLCIDEGSHSNQGIIQDSIIIQVYYLVMLDV